MAIHIHTRSAGKTKDSSPRELSVGSRVIHTATGNTGMISEKLPDGFFRVKMSNPKRREGGPSLSFHARELTPTIRDAVDPDYKISKGQASKIMASMEAQRKAHEKDPPLTPAQKAAIEAKWKRDMATHIATAKRTNNDSLIEYAKKELSDAERAILAAKKLAGDKKKK